MTAPDGYGDSGFDNSGFEDSELAPEEIVCVDCGGPCHRLTHPREDGRWYPGDIIAYRCRDCLDRWDLVIPGEDSTTD